MKKLLSFLFAIVLIILSPNLFGSQKPFAIIVHGGAGNYLNDTVNSNKIKSVILLAVDQGYKILEKGGTALDAIEVAIKILEDSPLFNAGKGSVLNEEGFVEMDASIMEGKELKAGAVAGVRNFPNPIVLARAVMEKTPHLLFAGEGIDKIIDKFKFKRISPDSLISPDRLEDSKLLKKGPKGTVGAVAIDIYGNIAAGTSTGGISNKMVGRVGDSPIIGAGTYAKNTTCGVSCTGTGEFFIRQSAAFHVSALIEYANYSLNDAVDYVLGEIKKMGATGGIIAIDKNCNIYFNYTTDGMPVGFQSSKGEKQILIFKDESFKK